MAGNGVEDRGATSGSDPSCCARFFCPCRYKSGAQSLPAWMALVRWHAMLAVLCPEANDEPGILLASFRDDPACLDVLLRMDCVANDGDDRGYALIDAIMYSLFTSQYTMALKLLRYCDRNFFKRHRVCTDIPLFGFNWKYTHVGVVFALLNAGLGDVRTGAISFLEVCLVRFTNTGDYNAKLGLVHYLWVNRDETDKLWRQQWKLVTEGWNADLSWEYGLWKMHIHKLLIKWFIPELAHLITEYSVPTI
jgi:hypothetical protein